MKFNLCIIRWLSVQYNNKNDFGFFIQLIRWARCDLYYIFTVMDSYRQKKNNNTGVGGNGSHSSGSGTGFFLQFFRGIGTGKRLKFVMHFGTGDEPLV